MKWVCAFIAIVLLHLLVWLCGVESNLVIDLLIGVVVGLGLAVFSND